MYFEQVNASWKSRQLISCQWSLSIPPEQSRKLGQKETRGMNRLREIYKSSTNPFWGYSR